MTSSPEQSQPESGVDHDFNEQVKELSEILGAAKQVLEEGLLERVNTLEKPNSEQIRELRDLFRDTKNSVKKALFSLDKIDNVSSAEQIKINASRAELEKILIPQLEAAIKTKEVEEAQNRLSLSDEWFKSELGAGLPDPDSLSKEELQEQIDKLDRFFQEIKERNNQVYQARDWINTHQYLAEDDRLKKENNSLEARIRAVKEEREAYQIELLKKGVDEGLSKAEIFWNEIKKRPPELGEDFLTFNKRAEKWSSLEAELNGIYQRACANTEVQKIYREKIAEIAEWKDKKVPLELARAALEIAISQINEAKTKLESIKTFEDLLDQIKIYKNMDELPEKEVVVDDDIQLWLYRFAKNVRDEIDAVNEFIQTGEFQDLASESGELSSQVNNFNLATDEFNKFLTQKEKQLIESKHRKRVKEAVTSENVQEGKAKAKGMFGAEEDSLARTIDIKEIKKEEVWGEIWKTLMTEHTFFGREKGEGSRAKVREQEALAIKALQRAFGKRDPDDNRELDNPYQLDNQQCEDLFYAAKQYIYERAVMDTEGGPREEMPVVPKEGSYQSDALPAEKRANVRKKGRFKKLTGALARGGVAFGAMVGLSPFLTPLGALAVVGAGRLVDDMVRGKLQLNKINKWKREKREQEIHPRTQEEENRVGQSFKQTFIEHLSFTIANLKENQQRAQAATAAQNYETYYNNTKSYLDNIDQDEGRYSETEKQKMAAAYAVFYDVDDQIERERINQELNRTPNARRWFKFLDYTFGASLRPGRFKFLKLTSPRDKLYAGTTSLGVSFALMAARQLPFVKHLTRAYAGYKYGGAAADVLAGRRSPEELTEKTLLELESELAKIEQIDLEKLKQEDKDIYLTEFGGLVSGLAKCRAVLNRIHNPIEYARQKERWKKICMAVLAEKFLLEEELNERDTEDKLKALGVEITEQEIRAGYRGHKEIQEKEERRGRRKRLLWRIGGAAALSVFGIVAEEVAEHLFGKRGGTGKKTDSSITEVTAKSHTLGTDYDKHPDISPHATGPGDTGPEITHNQIELATVDQRGIEGAFIRQLQHNPNLRGGGAPSVDQSALHFDKNGELILDSPEAQALHKWAGGEAHRIALKSGYVDQETGKEVWVKDTGPSGKEGNAAYILAKNGDKTVVTEYFNGKPVEPHMFPPDQKFEGADIEKNYEMLHPAKHPAIEQSTVEPKAHTTGIDQDVVSQKVVSHPIEGPQDFGKGHGKTAFAGREHIAAAVAGEHMPAAGGADGHQVDLETIRPEDAVPNSRLDELLVNNIVRSKIPGHPLDQTQIDHLKSDGWTIDKIDDVNGDGIEEIIGRKLDPVNPGHHLIDLDGDGKADISIKPIDTDGDGVFDKAEVAQVFIGGKPIDVSSEPGIHALAEQIGANYIKVGEGVRYLGAGGAGLIEAQGQQIKIAADQVAKVSVPGSDNTFTEGMLFLKRGDKGMNGVFVFDQNNDKVPESFIVKGVAGENSVQSAINILKNQVSKNQFDPKKGFSGNVEGLQMLNYHLKEAGILPELETTTSSVADVAAKSRRGTEETTTTIDNKADNDKGSEAPHTTAAAWGEIKKGEVDYFAKENLPETQNRLEEIKNLIFPDNPTDFDQEKADRFLEALVRKTGKTQDIEDAKDAVRQFIPPLLKAMDDGNPLSSGAKQLAVKLLDAAEEVK